MAWFSKTSHFDTQTLRIAHFTDSHLFADNQGTYFDVNTADYLWQVLQDIKQQNLDCAVFGGDLTQDHSCASYAYFARLIRDADLAIPVFWLPGNHDEVAEYELIENSVLNNDKIIENHAFKILLCNSKSETPAGCINAHHQAEIAAQLQNTRKSCVLFCHHHPIEIDGYLDKHKLLNGDAWLSELANYKHVLALFHGHVHNDYAFKYQHIEVIATPATCVQFTKYSATWQQQDKGPAYRIIELGAKQMKSEVRWLSTKQHV